MTNSHIEECGRRWAQADDRMRSLQSDFDAKHKENQDNRAADRADFEKFQKKLLLAALFLLGSIVLKGTNLDVLSHFLNGL